MGCILPLLVVTSVAVVFAEPFCTVFCIYVFSFVFDVLFGLSRQLFGCPQRAAVPGVVVFWGKSFSWIPPFLNVLSVG